MLYGAYGSLALDGSSAKIAVPGALAPETVICDWCYLCGVKRGEFIPQGDHEDHGDRHVVPAELLADDTICIMGYQHGWVNLLCTFEERWVFHVAYDGKRPPMEFTCEGFPEQSDADRRSEDEVLARPKVTPEILAHPGVVALRQRMEALVRRAGE